VGYFEKSIPNIEENDYLREPQKEAYQKIKQHFIEDNNGEHALVVLPTGTGKTGLMGIAPYGIAKKRVLIITPQTVIKDSVLGSLDPVHPNNFWLFTRVFEDFSELPTVIEYDKTITSEILHNTDIIILNVHKLQQRLDSSLLKRVEKDFFDLIIIDEAHHAEATTWKKAINYFEEAKILKVTGTPFRSDGKKLQGEEIYSYSLGRAMSMGYIKSLEKIDYIPEKLLLTLDKNNTKLYSLDEIRSMNLKDEEWIARSVALSNESNRSIVNQSLKYLEEKRRFSTQPHKIIAVACSIWHAKQIKEIYESEGMKCSIVHSELDKYERELEFGKIESHQVDVVINVAMLGEGYDHKYLTIAAIFRPYKSLLPYAQFVGRVLRSIDDENAIEDDNIAVAIHHKELGLDELWDYYKKEIKKRDIINKIKVDKFPIDPRDTVERDVSVGKVKESRNFKTEREVFIESELIKKREQKIEEEKKKIQELKDLLNISEEKAELFYKQSLKNNDKERYLRPDLFLKRKKKEIDVLVREDVIPQLLVDFDLTLEGNELIKNRFILPRDFQFIYKMAKNNGALLGNYFNLSLKKHIGEARDAWKLDDYDKAISHAKDLEIHIRNILNKYKG
jgi:superfamily II DNA or RNA helicase